MFKVACNHVPAHIKELRQQLSSFAQADYVE